MPTMRDSHNRGRFRPRHDPDRSVPVEAVYPPREDTFLLLPFAAVAPRTWFLEVGAGAGVVSLAAARRGARVVATDLNPRALRRLSGLAQTEQLDVQPVRTDLARGLGRFDRIVANPPYLPTRAEERDPDRWENLALDGGPDGCAVTARLVEDLDQHLSLTGAAFVVASTVQSAGGIRGVWERWRAKGGRVDRVAERELEGERLEVYRLEPPAVRDPSR